ncbi:MAG: hypothetical protein JXQ75_24030 [Phycisphaerae bacterium]|nr:hypothetical protein [Phycisphaerae bacterium]
MRRHGWILGLALAGALAGGGCGGTPNPALSLQFFDQVFVSIDPATFLSLNQALATKGYGNVTAADMRVKGLHVEAEFSDGAAPALALYTDQRFVPAGSAFMTMRVRDAYQAALDDPDVAGIVVNLGADRSYTISNPDLEAALPHLPEQESLPKDISVMSSAQ